MATAYRYHAAAAGSSDLENYISSTIRRSLARDTVLLSDVSAPGALSVRNDTAEISSA